MRVRLKNGVGLNSPRENIINTLRDKKVLFLENDILLSYGVDQFEKILKSADIECTVLCDLSNVPMEDIVKAINEHDTIVFMTQWVYEISKKLFDYIKGLTEKKTIVEVYLSEPTWFLDKQHGSCHDLYIYKFLKIFPEDESFYKISDTPYWEYKNKFDGS